MPDDHEIRISVLEREVGNMRDLPAKLSSVSEQVSSLSQSMIREVDGLRAQQKAHKEESTKERDNYQAEVKAAFEEQKKWMKDIWEKVSALTLNSAVTTARQKGWSQILTTLGQIVIGVAVIAEAVRAFH